MSISAAVQQRAKMDEGICKPAPVNTAAASSVFFLPPPPPPHFGNMCMFLIDIAKTLFVLSQRFPDLSAETAQPDRAGLYSIAVVEPKTVAWFRLGGGGRS